MASLSILKTQQFDVGSAYLRCGVCASNIGRAVACCGALGGPAALGGVIDALAAAIAQSQAPRKQNLDRRAGLRYHEIFFRVAFTGFEQVNELS